MSRLSRRAEDRTLCLTYLRHELRHRWWQALATAAGLAVGIALVVIVSAAASGTRAAQAHVLGSLDHAASSNAAAATVAGAVATASGLAADLGTWVAAAALIASFTIAALLTLASVGRRRTRLRRHRPGLSPGSHPDRRRHWFSRCRWGARQPAGGTRS